MSFDPTDPAELLWAHGLGLIGNSYDFKDELKAVGCIWNAKRRCWVARNDRMFMAAREIGRVRSVILRSSNIQPNAPPIPAGVANGTATSTIQATRGYGAEGGDPRLAGFSDVELIAEISHRGFGCFEARGESFAEALAARAADEPDFGMLEDP